MDFATIGWVVLIAVWLAVVLYLYWTIVDFWKERPMRCPETGAITLVAIKTVFRGGEAPQVTVRRCGLWPGKEDCGRGCLARCGETSPGWRFNLNALRPFGPK